jgi:hypothetical protein
METQKIAFGALNYVTLGAYLLATLVMGSGSRAGPRARATTFARAGAFRGG